MKTHLALVLCTALTACVEVPKPIQITAYSSSALAPKADKNGWYTFGNTYFKGALVNGAPDGSGICIDRDEENTPRQCNFENGNRVDSNHLAKVQSAIRAKEKKDQADAEWERQYARQQAREEAQARREMSAAINAQLRQTAQQMGALQNSFNSQNMNLYPDVAARVQAAEDQRKVDQYNTNSQNTGSSSESQFPLQLTGQPLPTDAEIKAKNFSAADREEYFRQGQCVYDDRYCSPEKREENRRDAERERRKKAEIEANENKGTPCVSDGHATCVIMK
jgi:hypothetical protein